MAHFSSPIATLITIAGATLVATSSPAAARPGEAVAAVPTTASSFPAADTRKYCVEDMITGSRVKRKICHTRADWMARFDFDPLAPKQQQR